MCEYVTEFYLSLLHIPNRLNIKLVRQIRPWNLYCLEIFSLWHYVELVTVHVCWRNYKVYSGIRSKDIWCILYLHAFKSWSKDNSCKIVTHTCTHIHGHARVLTHLRNMPRVCLWPVYPQETCWPLVIYDFLLCSEHWKSLFNNVPWISMEMRIGFFPIIWQRPTTHLRFWLESWSLKGFFFFFFFFFKLGATDYLLSNYLMPVWSYV